MKRALGFFVLLWCLPLVAQRFPPPGALPGSPFFIRKTWQIGGVGTWDYLTVDPVAGRLYIAHGPVVQVVDIETGALVGTIGGFRQAHQVLLDDAGAYGYVSDGPAGQVKIFDRATLQIVAGVGTGPSPRSIALDSESGLLFAICTEAAGAGESVPGGANHHARPQSQARRRASQGSVNRLSEDGTRSMITVIDAQRREALANVVIPGQLGFAQAAGDGRVFVTVADRNEILRIDSEPIGAMIRRLRGQANEAEERERRLPIVLDWGAHLPPPDDGGLQVLPLAGDCDDPLSLAIDRDDQRLFTACGNMRLVVTNAENGAEVTSLPIGPGADAVAYDPERRLIFTSNGGGDGSLTIIRQSVSDTYSVIQNLPTRQQARTLALDPSTGDIYLVTVLYGAKLGPPPRNGIGTMTMTAIDSSFQVLAVGN
ncbi:MAG TPA: hypothetical protein VMU48_01695 [Terracidiphilus sp.]|nr:hypothetical protein [Terracidiphilus sp.]